MMIRTRDDDVAVVGVHPRSVSPLDIDAIGTNAFARFDKSRKPSRTSCRRMILQGIVISKESLQIRWNHSLLKSLVSFSVVSKRRNKLY